MEHRTVALLVVIVLAFAASTILMPRPTGFDDSLRVPDPGQRLGLHQEARLISPIAEKRAKLPAMDDDDYANLADQTAARLRQAADRNAELKAIIGENDVVFGLYFDPESMSRWDKYLIKGEANSQSEKIACIWCKAIDEALALQRLAETFG